MSRPQHRPTGTGWLHRRARKAPVQKHLEGFIVLIQHSPLKFPLMAYGMMPSGHTRSGLEVAALLRRRSPSTDLLLLTLSSSSSEEEEEVDLLAATENGKCSLVIFHSFDLKKKKAEITLWRGSVGIFSICFGTWVCLVGLDGLRFILTAMGLFEHTEVIFIQSNVSQKSNWSRHMNTQWNSRQT